MGGLFLHFKRIVILVVMLLFLVTTVSASANNDSDSDVICDDSHSVNHLSKDVNTSKSLKQSTSNVKVNNYKQLYDAVINKSSNSSHLNITLMGSSVYTIDKTILVSNSLKHHNITINGNGRIISGNNSQTFMNISDKSFITINNLSIVNTSGSSASAFNNNGTLNISNVSFVNNCILSRGILFNRGNVYLTNIVVDNSLVIGDRDDFLETHGDIRGTITNYGTLHSNKCIYKNLASRSGVVVDNYGYLEMINNTIINVTSDFGSIVSYVYSISIINRNIFENISGTYGGAIANYGEISVRNNKFTNCSASTGGVIFNVANITICDNTFTSNNAYMGGVIYNQNNTVGTFARVYNNTFKSNSASIGGAIINYANMTVYSNVFYNNTVSNVTEFHSNELNMGSGAAIFNNATMDVSNNSFTFNVVKSGDGFVLENNGFINITGNYFENNTDLSRDMLIYSHTNKYHISNNTYIGNLLNNTLTVSIKNNVVYASLKLSKIYNDSVCNGTIVIYVKGYENNKKNFNTNTTNIKINNRNLQPKTNLTVKYLSLQNHYNTQSKMLMYTPTINHFLNITQVPKVYEGTIVNITTKVYDRNNKALNGNLTFKINNKTLLDSKGKIFTASLKNGTATIKYNATQEGRYEVEAIYKNSSETMVFKAIKRPDVAIMTVTASPNNTKMGRNVTFTTRITIGDKNLSTGFVIFKINGVTVKYDNGSDVRANLVNGVASINFTIPDGWSAKAVKVTSVYSQLTYGRLENKTYFNITRIGTHFNVTSITGTLNSLVTIKAKLLDENNHLVLGESAVAVKINGQTIKRFNGKTQYFVAVNGTVDISFLILNFSKPGNYTIQLVTGTRVAYSENRTNITHYFRE